MLLFAVFFGTLTIFVGTILLVSRPSNERKLLLARFAQLQANPASTSKAADALLALATPGALDWIDRTLKRMAAASGIPALLLQSDSKTTLKKLFLMSVATASLGALATLIFLPILPVAIAVGFAAGYVPIVLLAVRRGRRVAAFNKALPDVIDMMSRSLRAGYSMVAAIGIVAENAPQPARHEFAEVFRKQNFGLPLRDAMLQMLERVPSQDLRVLVTGMLVQKDTGGNLAEIMDRIVAVIRERLKIQGEIRTQTAQGRMTGWILCLLPVALFLVINFINPGYADVMLTDPFGRKLLYVGLGLLVTGGFFIRRIVNSIEV